MERKGIVDRCLIMTRFDPEMSQRRKIIQSLALEFGEDFEYIERLVTFFSGSFFGVPTTEQKERVEKHLQNKADEQYRQRINRKWNGNLIFFNGRSQDNG